jgi:hypothetical protein
VAVVEPGDYTLTVMCDSDLLQVYGKPMVIHVK